MVACRGIRCEEWRVNPKLLTARFVLNAVGLAGAATSDAFDETAQIWTRRVISFGTSRYLFRQVLAAHQSNLILVHRFENWENARHAKIERLKIATCTGVHIVFMQNILLCGALPLIVRWRRRIVTPMRALCSCLPRGLWTAAATCRWREADWPIAHSPVPSSTGPPLRCRAAAPVDGAPATASANPACDSTLPGLLGPALIFITLKLSLFNFSTPTHL